MYICVSVFVKRIQIFCLVARGPPTIHECIDIIYIDTYVQRGYVRMLYGARCDGGIRWIAHRVHIYGTYNWPLASLARPDYFGLINLITWPCYTSAKYHYVIVSCNFYIYSTHVTYFLCSNF